ncbi:hypothetical protein AWC27_08405 [Mycobacterium szulgai]|uniref:Uncharacterized protein n=1 Tax=Mycobacterium szulgai TaxID=1787 RepID=A0A1X2DYF5_MYCSZ|nr:hypothetical protein AWC27_08405 [Mycobacterium szulgai]
MAAARGCPARARSLRIALRLENSAIQFITRIDTRLHHPASRFWVCARRYAASHCCSVPVTV